MIGQFPLLVLAGSRCCLVDPRPTEITNSQTHCFICVSRAHLRAHLRCDVLSLQLKHPRCLDTIRFAATLVGLISSACRLGCATNRYRRALPSAHILSFQLCTYPESYLETSRSELSIMQSISQLPAELIDEIVGSLCLYCCPPHTEPREYECQDEHCWSPEERLRVKTLTSLCMTSKSLNASATRHLYHCPTPEKWSSLARTLITAPDKARCVKDLRLGVSDWPDDSSLIPETVVAYRGARIEAYVPVLGSVEDFDRAEYFADYSFEGTVHAEGFVHYNDNITVDIVTSLCPSLERLEASLGYFKAFCFCAPNSLMALTHVSLRHNDTEGGLGLDDITDLFRAAPNLTSISLYQVSMEGDDDDGDDGDDGSDNDSKDVPVPLHLVKYLRLQNSAVGKGALGVILRTCPNLETFEYDAGGSCIGYEQFTPLQAKDMIFRYAPSLRAFRLDLTNADFFVDDGEVGFEEAEEALTSRGIDYSLL